MHACVRACMHARVHGWVDINVCRLRAKTSVPFLRHCPPFLFLEVGGLWLHWHSAVTAGITGYGVPEICLSTQPLYTIPHTKLALHCAITLLPPCPPSLSSFHVGSGLQTQVPTLARQALCWLSHLPRRYPTVLIIFSLPL